jgi:hypothetical protein
VAGIDPITGQLTALFDPRRHNWEEHFGWNGAQVVGRTAKGRVSIAVLDMNDADYVALRASLIVEGLFLQ